MLKQRWGLMGLMLVACGGAPPAEAPPSEPLPVEAPPATPESAAAETAEAPPPEGPTAEPASSEAPKFDTQIRLGAVTVVGDTNKDAITEAIKSHLSEVDSCYQSALSANPNLSGRITLKVDVPASGAPFLIAGPQSDIEDDSLIECVSQAVLEMPLVEHAPGSKLSIPIVLMK
ncbi:MAG: AgmX/PglI C-terminal domain-containing protein [Polyangiaceae bacterium]|nr:AgmX/PglI C-terminal domain-containing protein [Myxococcales bacterium]MCB9589873.1 AgmX/PglI C-terminal domain-containing protein [Polyangiaceae bacterium]